MDTLLYFYARHLSSLLFRFLFRLEVKGMDNLEGVSCSCIIAPNHQSYLDPPLLAVLLPKRLTYFAKAGLFNVPVLSFFVRSIGVIPIERDTVSSLALRRGLDILTGENPRCLVIFPEGTRSRSEEMLPAQKGIGFLHKRSRAPIIPVWIEGSGRALPVGARFVRPGRIKVVIGRPLHLESRAYDEIAREVVDSVKKLKPS